MALSRRRLVSACVASAALYGCGTAGRSFGPCRDSTARKRSRVIRPLNGLSPFASLPESDRFELGVATGDATQSHATAWTRYRGARSLGLQIWERDGQRRGTLLVDPADGGYTHCRVGGLRAGRWYRYAFAEMRGERAVARSPVGQFRTAIAEGASEPLTLGATSCVYWNVPQRALRSAASLDMDLLLALGDTSYNDGAHSLCEYREAWTHTLSGEGWRVLRARTSQLATWDDHEVQDDFAGPHLDRDQFLAGRRAFFEHMPVRRLAGRPDRIWRRARWGRTAEIFVLDCRGERRPETRGRGDAAMLSREQLAWLKRGLAASDAVFKIIMTSVPISEFPLDLLPKRHDRWEPYAAQREDLLRFVERRRLDGVIWVGGDLHVAVAGRVGARSWRPGGEQLEVLVGPGAQHVNDLTRHLRPPQFDFAAAENNVTTIALDPARVEARIQWHGERGQILGDLRYDLQRGVRLLRD